MAGSVWSETALGYLPTSRSRVAKWLRESDATEVVNDDRVLHRELPEEARTACLGPTGVEA